MRKLVAVFIVSLFFFLSSHAVISVWAHDIIDVPFSKQEMGSWGWAAISWSILHHYGETPTQCEIVNHALYRYDCCGYPSACNRPNYMCGSQSGSRGIAMVLSDWNTPNSCVGALTRAQIRAEVDQCHPFVIFWESTTTTGRFVLGEGIDEARNRVYIIDPWPGMGKMYGAYEWVKNPSGSLYWGSTLKTDRSSDCPPSPEDEALSQCVPTTLPYLSQGAWKYYSFDLPKDAASVVVKMSGETGDGDLYLRFGQKPEPTVYDCRPFRNGSNEECVIDVPQAGRYYAGVHAFSPISNLKLEACWSDGEEPPPAIEIIVDDNDAANVSSTGYWLASSGPNPYGGGSRYADTNQGSFTFKPKITKTCKYTLFAHWTYHANRGAAVPITVNHAGGEDTVYVNMKDASLGGQWNLIGKYTFDVQSPASVVIKTTQGQACADAVKLVEIVE